MGSGASRPRLPCLRPATAGEGSPEPDETLGHSFYYSSAADAVAETTFKTISGAAVSANSSAPPLAIFDSSAVEGGGRSRGASFRSSSSFSALPLQLATAGGAASGPLDRGFFLSGPIERGALSGPLDPVVPFSGPLPKKKKRRGLSARIRLQRTLSEKNRPWVFPLRSLPNRRCDPNNASPAPAGGNVEWAHGKAGEDRVHVVVSEEHRWLFVGIYDGFNGPEAPEFLVDNLYRSVFNQLEGLFWENVDEGSDKRATFEEEEDQRIAKPLWEFLAEADGKDELDFSGSGRFAFSLSKLRNGIGSWRKEGRRVWFPRWRYDSDEKAKEVEIATETSGRQRRKTGSVSDHKLVLSAMAGALEATELAYLEMTDRAMDCNPELALMGSCLLVVLMRDEDVYVMNVGDSRAIVAQYMPQGAVEGRGNGEFGASLEEGIVDRPERGVWNSKDGLEIETAGHGAAELAALQLSTDHSTSIEGEVLRIREEHPDDNQCVVNGRVKGRLKVTRAFGAGYLKQPKWNNALLEMFRNEYIGTAPYISCTPSLRHYKLGANDQFLVLSSDGLYQYLSNEEVVLHVESFMERFPDGDPAQSLIEELLSRAAKTAGMDFHELLDIPQGDRRKYHDDVTVMVISLEGRIWKSSGKYV